MTIYAPAGAERGVVMKLYGKMEEQWEIGVGFMSLAFFAIVAGFASYFSPPINKAISLASLILGLLGFIYGFFLRLSIDSKMTKINRQLDLLEEKGSADDIINFGWFKHGINLANPESILSLGCHPKRLGRFILSYLHIQYEEMKIRCCEGVVDGDTTSTDAGITKIYLLWVRMIAYAVVHQNKENNTFAGEFFDGCEMSRHSKLYADDIRRELNHYAVGYYFLTNHLLPRWDDRRKEIRQQTELHKKLGIA